MVSTLQTLLHLQNPPPYTPWLAPTRSMEEVWKDISLASLNEPPADSIISSRTKDPNFPSTMLMDFLDRPINLEPPSPKTSRVSNDTSVTQGAALLGSQSAPAATLLSLNSGSDFQYAGSGDPARPNPAVNAPTGSSHNSTNFNGFGHSAISSSFFCQKKAPESSGNSNDRRYKRMMKNRESAARSRARKQAYTNELELEVTRLQEENAKLRKQQQKLLSAPEQLPKKNSLARTSTAPF